MAAKIRLARDGAKKRPYYRIVVANSHSPRDSNFVQKLGHYNPLLPSDSPTRIVADAEKVKYWLSVGAQPTTTVKKLFKRIGIPLTA